MTSTRRSTPRRLAVVALVGVLLLAAAWAVATLYDNSRAHRLAPGIRIDGVDVGGMSKDAALAKLRKEAVAPRLRALRVHAEDATFALPASALRVRVDIDAAVDRAVADSRRGWLGARIVHDISGHRVVESLRPSVHYAPGVVGAFVAKVAAQVNREPVDAQVKPEASGLTQTPGEVGRELNARSLRWQIQAATLDPKRSADITATTNAVEPKVTTAQLASKYPAYIVVDRKAHQLRFFDHLTLSRTYPIAVGRQGLETPPGLYDIQWREVNPPWRVPNSKWAGALAGKTIPPGPDDPIKARWMAFDGGAGIHGIDPSEYGSIGHDASHGCVRMRIPDVISLYARSPVGTPVYIA